LTEVDVLSQLNRFSHTCVKATTSLARRIEIK